MATKIGMMDSAYFVGRSEILAWINSTLQLNLSKVEEVLIISVDQFSHRSLRKLVLDSDLRLSSATSVDDALLGL